jgi:mono/diheme cytochrome c family protein
MTPLRCALLVALCALAGCDDMTHEAKRNPWARRQGDPAQEADGTVRFEEAPLPPPRLSLALIERGQDRFRIFCTPCHSELGDGNGMIPQRGFSPPPSYHTDRLRRVTTQHFYDVITQGYGAMYSFAQRIPPADRWAIAAYIRALQRSREATLADLTPAERQALP